MDEHLPLNPPAELLRLVEARLWPASHQQACEQNTGERIASDDVRRLIPTESEIHLYPPPWRSFAADHARMKKRLGEQDAFVRAMEGTFDQIDPAMTLFIADFGLGSDAPVLLDFRTNPDDPPVVGFKWIGGSSKVYHARWVQLSPSFSAFVEALRLWHLPKFTR